MFGLLCAKVLELRARRVNRDSSRCVVCGHEHDEKHAQVICRELARDWNLNERQRQLFDYREGTTCRNCGSNVRTRNLGAVLLQSLNEGTNSSSETFVELLPGFEKKAFEIAEINNCGPLHNTLKELGGLIYSEYVSSNPEVPSQDLLCLTYDSQRFDIVIMTDVLEHVPDYHRALDEIQRVLRRGGYFIFTVPFLMDRKTVQRARMTSKGSVEHFLPPSFHGDYRAQQSDYLVFFEFGWDFVLSLFKRFWVEIFTFDETGLVTSVFRCQKR